MGCNHPLPAWFTRERNDNGNYQATFTHRLADDSRKLELPCGRCIGCRLEKARQWAMRLMHETRLHEHNHFVTLTYSDENLPPGATLRPEDMTLFLKRLRKRHQGLRYYQCGEYGDHTERPHHHAIMFNLELQDLRELPRARKENAHALYTSRELEETWQQGIVSIGAVTFETAAYCASYVTKKIVGPMADVHYQGRVPEYATMSRRPGIGRGYRDKYRGELEATDEVIIRGFPMRPPRYYDRLLDKEDPDAFAQVKLERQKTLHHLNYRQRAAREANQYAKMRLHRRREL